MYAVMLVKGTSNVRMPFDIYSLVFIKYESAVEEAKRLVRETDTSVFKVVIVKLINEIKEEYTVVDIN